MEVRFGKHRGKDSSDPSIPEEYIEWLIDKQKKDTRMWEEELERRRTMAEANESAVVRLAKAGFRALSLKTHPDHGGTAEAFREAQESYEYVVSLLRAKGIRVK